MNDAKLTVRFLLAWAALAVPLLFLQHGLDVDAAFSPTWQLVLHHALFIPFSLMWYVASAYLFLPRDRWARWASVGILAGLLALVSALGWWSGEAALGLRNPAVPDMAALFAVLSPFAVILYRLARLGTLRGLLEGPWDCRTPVSPA